jgi:hypothetical protein
VPSIAEFYSLAGGLCPECDAHLDKSLEDPMWLLRGAVMSMRTGKDFSLVIMRYLMVFHMFGHPTDEEAARLAADQEKRNAQREAAPCN